MPLRFRHECIDPNPPGAHHDITLLTDLDGDGRLDIVIAEGESHPGRPQPLAVGAPNGAS